jgi:eukaryotic-like serine/threonine-protein kinase
VYDAGKLDTRECYMVTEMLEGVNLEELVRASGPLPVATTLSYVTQACAGLLEAHSKGIVHRDIKLANLFLAHSRGTAPVIKVMDFGVARWVGDELQNSRLTSPGVNIGTPCYQSPEQLESAGDVDGRSDIWGLGLVLFELLTGYCPFEGSSIQETCWKVLQGKRPALKETLPDIDPRLDAIVQRCLQIDRAERFQSVQHLQAALQALSSAEPQRPAAPSSRIQDRLTPTSGAALPLVAHRPRGRRLLHIASFSLAVAAALTTHPEAPRTSRMQDATTAQR